MSWSSDTAASPQNSPANSTKGRFRRLRAKAQAANSIAVKENPFIFLVDYSVTLLHGDPGTRRRGYKQTRVFNSEQTEETQEHRSGHLYTSVDINNNPQETWGRTDYI